MHCCQTSAPADDPPPQIYPGMPSVVPRLHAVKYGGPLGGHDCHQKIEPRGAETVPHKKSA